MDQDFTLSKRPNDNIVKPKIIAPPSRPGKLPTPVTNTSKVEPNTFSDIFEGDLPAIDETGSPLIKKTTPTANPVVAEAPQNFIPPKTNPTNKAGPFPSAIQKATGPKVEDYEDYEDDYDDYLEEPYVAPQKTPVTPRTGDIPLTPKLTDDTQLPYNRQRAPRELSLPENMAPQGQMPNQPQGRVATREQPPRNQKPSPQETRSLFSKATGERKASRNLNPRLTAKLIRTSMMGGLLLFAALGLYGVVNPNTVPTGAELNSTINQATGKSNFPTDKANGFIVAFADTYFTKTEATSSSSYSDSLELFAPEALVSMLKVNYDNNSIQEVTEGPYISGIRYIDDYMVSYTISVKLSTSDNWIYTQIPVFYNQESKSFTIAGVPGIVPVPPRSNLPSGYSKKWSNDDTISKDVKTDFENFFIAWGSSNPKELNRLLSPKASLEASLGLNGAVEFSSLNKVEVQSISDDPEYTKQRIARANVKWKNPNGTSYTSVYEMLIEFDGTRWNVRDIRAGIPE